jgi:tRNA splicing ligase
MGYEEVFKEIAQRLPEMKKGLKDMEQYIRFTEAIREDATEMRRKYLEAKRKIELMEAFLKAEGFLKK